MPNPTVAGIYCRISQDRTGEGLGVERQEADCRQLAERLGWQVAGVYTDNDVSAFSKKPRKAFLRLLDDLKNGTITAVLAWHSDRLYRRLEDLAPLVEVVETTGAQIGTATSGDLDLSTASGRVMARIMGSLSAFESEHKGERQRRKQQEIREAGGVSGGGHRAYGFERDGLTLVEDEAQEIRRAVAYVLAGGSVRGLLKDLNERAVTTSTGKLWTTQSLRRMLMSGRIAGLREHQGQVVGTAAWPAIITESEHQRIRRLLGDPGRRTTPGPARSYLLTGWIRCAACGAQMIGRRRVRLGNGTPVRRYVCDTGHGGCGRVGILADPVEKMVADYVITALDSPKLGTLVEDRAAVEVAEISSQMDDLADLFASRQMTRAQFQRANERLVADLAEAEAQAASETRRGALVALAGHLATAWPTMTLDQRRAVIDEVVESVVVAERVSPNRFDAGRLSVVWRV